MVGANATVPGVLQPWGGPRACDSRSKCLLDRHGNALSPIKVVCVRFDMHELRGTYCSCDYLLTRVGPTCDTATPTTRKQISFNAAILTLDAVLLVMVLHKLARARKASKRLKANAGLAVALLSVAALCTELVHSVGRLLVTLGSAGGGKQLTTRVAAVIVLATPGMALLLSFSVWTRLARSGAGQHGTQVKLDRFLFLATMAFFVRQMSFALLGQMDRALRASAALMAVLLVIYPISGCLLLRKIENKQAATASRTAARLRAFIRRVTVLIAIAFVGIVVLEWSAQLDAIDTFEVLMTSAPAFYALKVVYGVLSFIMASFSLDTIILRHAASRDRVVDMEAAHPATNLATSPQCKPGNNTPSRALVLAPPAQGTP